LKVEPVWALAN